MKKRIIAKFEKDLGSLAFEMSFTVPAQGFIGIFGESGSGKTTLLRCLAGLEKIDNGYLEVNGECWQNEKQFVPTYKRSIGYVFQESSLFPHLSVKENLKFGWKRIDKSVRQSDLDDITELLGLTHLLERATLKLSGGERQRVAIARALVTSPQLLLMDEPLSALDVKSKSEILPYFERIKHDLSIPVMYVTHSFNEISYLADQLLIVRNGKIEKCGDIDEMAGYCSHLTQFEPFSQRNSKNDNDIDKIPLVKRAADCVA